MPDEGVREDEIEQLRSSISAAIDSAVSKLREIEADTHKRLRDTNLEQQHLHHFLDEIQYSLRTINASQERPVTITGPLTDTQMQAITSQEGNLVARRDGLEKISSELEQLSNRLSWLVHQIDGACAWVLSSGGQNSSESTSDTSDNNENSSGQEAAIRLQPSPGEQVMWAQMVMGQEAERARLAREIHDGPAQALANTVMRLALVEQMYKHSPQDVQAELANMRTALQESLKDVRRFIFDLRPASLTDAGLLYTLRQYTHDYGEQYNVAVELNAPENLTLSPNQELALFRIVQESLQNIHKHAEAERVEVNIQQRQGGPLTLTIADNGRGFDPKSVRTNSPSSSGLVGMKERAATAGGTLKVDSRSGIGTTITLVLPKVS